MIHCLLIWSEYPAYITVSSVCCSHLLHSSFSRTLWANRLIWTSSTRNRTTALHWGQSTISLNPDRTFQRESWPTSVGRKVPNPWQDRHTSQRFSWRPWWACSPQRDQMTLVFVWMIREKDYFSLVTGYLSKLQPDRHTFLWPDSRKKVCQFLGFANFYYIHHHAEILVAVNGPKSLEVPSSSPMGLMQHLSILPIPWLCHGVLIVPNYSLHIAFPFSIHGLNEDIALDRSPNLPPGSGIGSANPWHQSNVVAEILKQKPETELHCLVSQTPASWTHVELLIISFLH